MTLDRWRRAECPACGMALLLPPDWPGQAAAVWVQCACGCAFELVVESTPMRSVSEWAQHLDPHAPPPWQRVADTPQASNVRAIPAAECCGLTETERAQSARLLASVDGL